MDPAVIKNLDFTKEIGQASKRALESENVDEFARLLDVHWRNKRNRTTSVSNNRIDELYEMAIDWGALGGKLLGGGGAGYLLFYTRFPAELRAGFQSQGVVEVPYSFEEQGVRVLSHEEISADYWSK